VRVGCRKGRFALHGVNIQTTTRTYQCLTAIESFSPCGSLEPWTAAVAAEAKRTDTQLTRGARNARHTRFEDNLNAIVDVKKQNATKQTVYASFTMTANVRDSTKSRDALSIRL
jgi:hypothetical protein